MRVFANGLRTLTLATIGLSALLLVPQAANAQFTTFISSGHADIEVASLPFPDGDTLEMAVHDDITDEEYDPATTLFLIEDAALTTRNAQGQSGAAFDFLGVGVNDPYYLVFPTGGPGAPIIGVTSEEVDLTEFQDNIVFSLTGYTGPGTFSLYSNASNVFFNAAPGNVITGTLPSTPSSGHTDYFYAFSAPGLYELTIQAQGTLLDGVTQRTASATYFFNAGPLAATTVPEAGTLPLMIGAGCSVIGILAVRRRARKS
ncbi:MAG: choice-of-anchor M domain-containing protein [Fibrella sp.]|nr:choice-of-anchor M domain-containing protein [Armatimonadota bacterium]